MTINQNALYATVGNRVRHQIQVKLEMAAKWYPKVCTVIPSNKAYEEYDWLGAFPEVREWLGDMMFDQLSSAEFLIKNKDWYNGIKLPKKAIDDGDTGYFDQLEDGLVEMFTRHPDKLVFDLMKSGESVECFDGQNFFDTDHVWGDSGVQSNLLSKTVADVNDLTKAEAVKLVKDVLVNMLGLKNDRGEPFVFPTAHTIKDLVVVCPLHYWTVFDEAFTGTMKVEGGAAIPNYTIVKPEVVPLPSYTGNFFDVYRVGQAIKPFVFQDRKKVSMFTKDHDDPEALDIKVGGTGRYNVGPLAWWLATRVNLTNAA